MTGVKVETLDDIEVLVPPSPAKLPAPGNAVSMAHPLIMSCAEKSDDAVSKRIEAAVRALYYVMQSVEVC